VDYDGDAFHCENYICQAQPVTGQCWTTGFIMPYPTEMKINFVSDIACPWCAVGLNSLEVAIRRIQQSDSNIDIQIDMQPFEIK
jgi:hypothetical protein